MDLSSNSIKRLLLQPDFYFREGDISINNEWIEYHVRKCDIILPLVAIATPAEYVRNPLRVFELDFEENLRIVNLRVYAISADPNDDVLGDTAYVDLRIEHPGESKLKENQVVPCVFRIAVVCNRHRVN